MRDPRTKARGLALSLGLCAVAIAAGLQVQPASAQDKAATAALGSAQQQATNRAIYYVETGKSYGDLDDDYLTASYRVYMTEAEAKRVFAYIRHLQATSPLWNAATYNCVAFIQDIARYMGLRVPGNHLLYPEDWVNSLKQINGGRRYMSSPAVAQASSTKPSAAAQKPAPSAAAQKPAASAGAQTASASGGY